MISNWSYYFLLRIWRLKEYHCYFSWSSLFERIRGSIFLFKCKYVKRGSVKTQNFIFHFFPFFLSQKRQNMFMEHPQILNRTTTITTTLLAKKRFNSARSTLSFMVQVFDKVQQIVQNPQIHICWIITTQHLHLMNALGNLGKVKK